MAAPAGNSRCGFCGYLSPHVGIGEAAWTSRFRAVYSTDPHGGAPRLSSVGLNRDSDMPGNLAPPEPYQRYDDRDLDPRSLVLVRGPRPPDGPSFGVPDATAEGEQTCYTQAWGFLFHDACWRLLERACAPDAVDVATLWRVLLSVPCARDLPNWGHNYGFLFLAVGPAAKKNPRTGQPQSFVRLHSPAPFIIPSTYSDPFDVPELAGTVRAMMRIGTGEEAAARASSSHREPPVSINGPSADTDPFAALPTEIREMLLAYAASPDVANLRLASRAIAAVPLMQQFFRSRFYPGRELDRVFDGFLLAPAERRGLLDWAALYGETRARLRTHRVWLGERNRYRIWDETLRPLSRALGAVARLGRLRGGRMWYAVLGDDDKGGFLLGSCWRGIATECYTDFEAFGLRRRTVHVAEVELPRARVKAVGVSLVSFFDREYITGLRFVFARPVDDVEIGYIAPHSEAVLRVEDALRGFHAAVDHCGFRGLSVITSGHMRSEYPTWAGAPQGFEAVPIKAGGDAVRRIKAAFDVRSPPSRVTKS
ncbi:hypothetical protein DL770_010654 [Monosporascus sp. CRB-9-2]|nr:hypothetical protein DL770_010654 [Monosporascus sp. CRB-9-2]